MLCLVANLYNFSLIDNKVFLYLCLYVQWGAKVLTAGFMTTVLMSAKHFVVKNSSLKVKLKLYFKLRMV